MVSNINKYCLAGATRVISDGMNLKRFMVCRLLYCLFMEGKYKRKNIYYSHRFLLKGNQCSIACSKLTNTLLYISDNILYMFRDLNHLSTVRKRNVSYFTPINGANHSIYVRYN